LIDDDAIARCEMEWMANLGQDDNSDDDFDEGWSVGEADNRMTFADIETQMAAYYVEDEEHDLMETALLHEAGAL
jgi:hypothetical protein